MSSSWTPKPPFCGGRVFLKALSRGTCGSLCALLLASCGGSPPAGYPGSAESTTQSGTLQPLTVPPNSTDRPPAPGLTGASKTADGLPALHVKGTNNNLFSKKMSDEADRLDRLENAVQELRNDFDAMAPAIVRLVAIESDIQGLIKQLEVLTGAETMPSAEVPPIEESYLYAPGAPQNIVPNQVVAPTQEGGVLPPLSVTTQSPKQPVPHAQEPAVVPMDSPTYPAVESPPIAASAQIPPQAVSSAAPPQPATVNPSGVNVMDIRIGEHPGKTRIVLDVKGKSTFTADLDNQEKILVIEIPQAGWNAATQKTLTGSPIIASYRVERLPDGGTMLIIQLKKSSVISYRGTMEGAGGAQRLIIDLTASP